MARPPHILTTRPILNRQRRLRNHLSRIRPNNMHAEDPIRLRITHKLHHPLRIQISLRPRIRRKRERADAVLDILLLELDLVLPHPRHLRVRVHDGGDGVVVYMPVGLGEVLDGGDGFFFAFVCEHGAEGDVADGADVRDLGAVFVVDDDAAFAVELEADLVEAEVLGEGAAADGYEGYVGVELGRSGLVRE